jgi:acetylornithine deacetylase
MNKHEKELVTSVQSLKADIIDFTCRLVSQPSTLGNEASVLAVMERELEKLGLGPERVAIDPQVLAHHPGFAPVPWDYQKRYNVVAKRAADGEGGRSALFNGHLDVVSPEPLDRWQHDPFDPVVKDGWIYGRGAGDMKAGVSAMTYAVKAFENAGMGLKGPVTIETVIEEECSGNGALACLQAGLDGDAVLIPEPFGPAILTAQVGVAWFRVTLHGKPQHVQDVQAGVNAIEKCFPLFKALRDLEEDLNHPVHPAFRGVNHPINLNIGVLKGGDWPSTVPARAEFHCRLGFFPGVPFRTVRERIVEALSRAALADPWLAENPPKVDFYAFRSEGHSLSPDLPAFQTLSDCQKDLTGERAVTRVSTATTDVRSFVHFGKGQATCFGPVAENVHAENERVLVESVIHTAKVYALFLARWCGIAE